MLRERIIENVASDLSRFGIRECRMDYIASSLSVSKKTLYEHFGSKRNLLYQCVCYSINLNKEQIMAAEQASDSPLEIIARVNSVILRQALKFCPAFYRDIQSVAEYSKLVNGDYVKYVHECYQKYLDLGAKEGLFLERVNMSHAIRFFDDQIRRMYELSLSDTIMRLDDYTFTILTYLAGICTDKGRKELEKIRTDIF